MQRLQIILVIAVVILVGSPVWQIGAWEVANMNLQEEMRDMASQAGARVGAVAPSSDEDLSRSIILKAKDHDIELQPAQITVRRTISGETSTLYLAADYTVPVNLLFVSFSLHFTPNSEQR
jgi:hypothetical protein